MVGVTMLSRVVTEALLWEREIAVVSSGGARFAALLALALLRTRIIGASALSFFEARTCTLGTRVVKPSADAAMLACTSVTLGAALIALLGVDVSVRPTGDTWSSAGDGRVASGISIGGASSTKPRA